MAKVTVKDVNNIPSIVKETDKLNRHKIKTGYWGDGDLEMIAAVHEFGLNIKVTDKMRRYLAAIGYPLKASTMYIRIPERSFLRAGWDENEAIFQKNAGAFIDQMLGLHIHADVLLDSLARDLKGRLQTYMRDLKSPPLSKMTIDLKDGKSNPLANTGHLIGSMRSEVVSE